MNPRSSDAAQGMETVAVVAYAAAEINGIVETANLRFIDKRVLPRYDTAVLTGFTRHFDKSY